MEPLVLNLESDYKLTVTVTDAAGNAVDRVLLILAEGKRRDGRDLLGATGPDGRYVFRWVPGPGRYALLTLVRESNWTATYIVSADVQDKRAEVNIAVGAGMVHGQLWDIANDREVPHASVSLQGLPLEAPTARYATVSVNMQTWSNAEGLYSFPWIPPGRYTLSVRKEGYELFTQEFEVAGVETKRDVELKPTQKVGSIVGKVKDSSRRGVNATVIVYGKGGEPTGLVVNTTAAGTF